MTKANSANPDQMPQNAASDLDFHCLPTERYIEVETKNEKYNRKTLGLVELIILEKSIQCRLIIIGKSILLNRLIITILWHVRAYMYVDCIQGRFFLKKKKKTYLSCQVNNLSIRASVTLQMHY